MASSGAGITLRGRFAPGTKVGLFPRYGDVFPGHVNTPLERGTVDKLGEVSFDGLKEAERFFIVNLEGEPRAVAVTAKPQTSRQRLSAGEIADRLAQTRPADAAGPLVTGPRTTASTRIGRPTPKEDREPEPQPAPRQEDVRDAEQRSATLTGQAVPKDPDEIVPQPSQSDIPAKTEQRSATPLGIATPKPVDEEVPGKRQEDQSGPQRSATETGQAAPKPRRASPAKQQQVKDSAESKAKGAPAAVAGTDKRGPAGKPSQQSKK